MGRKIVLSVLLSVLSMNTVFSIGPVDLFEAENRAHILADTGNWAEVKQLLNQHENIDPNCTDNGFTSLLHKAVASNQFDIIQYLVEEREADVNAQDGLDMTPLHKAIVCRLGNVALYLLAHGASVNIQDVTGDTPLHHIIRYSKPAEFVQFLELFARTNKNNPSLLKTSLNLQNKEKQSVLSIGTAKKDRALSAYFAEVC